MKMYLISDNVDTYTGMRLAGVDGIPICGQHKIWKSGQRLFLQLHRKRVHRQSDAEGRHQEGPSDRDHR